MNQSYVHDIFMAEEISRGIKIDVGDVITPEIKIPEFTKTEETRPTWPHIINHNLTEVNKIYEIKIPREGLRVWSLRCRNKVDIQYSFEPSFSTYMTLGSGETVNQDTAPNTSIYSIYVRSATANVTVELELWR